MKEKIIDKEYLNLLDDIKTIISNTRNKVFQNVNKELMLMNYNIGLKILKYNKWGTSYIDNLSKDIKIEYPNIKGMSARNLRYMQKFAKEFDNDEFLQQYAANLPWTTITTIMDYINEKNIRIWYIKETLKNGWLRTILIHQIKLKLYERQALSENKITNFNKTFPYPTNMHIEELIKNPYLFDFIYLNKNIKEKDIEDQLVNNITKLLLELGNGFAFVGRQYHLEIENEDYYIDLLFYNSKLKCYTVVELKNTEFKPEYIGKLNFYLNAVDTYVKEKDDNPSFGILLCRNQKKITAELSLKNIDKPIGISEYKILSEIPEYLENTLPSIKYIEKRLEKMN